MEPNFDEATIVDAKYMSADQIRRVLKWIAEVPQTPPPEDKEDRELDENRFHSFGNVPKEGAPPAIPPKNPHRKAKESSQIPANDEGLVWLAEPKAYGTMEDGGRRGSKPQTKKEKKKRR